jgi:hypothetical protein
MISSRRNFFKRFTIGSAYLLTGGFSALAADDIFSSNERVRLRFAVGSDAHYGQPDTEFAKFLKDFVTNINTFNQSFRLDACIVNGDIIHDKKEFLEDAKQALDKLSMPYFVTQGNHDQVTPEYWQEIWKTPHNNKAKAGSAIFLMMSTSNERGEYLSPNLKWLKEQLDEHKTDNVFLFLHIGQQKWTKGSIDNSEYAGLIKNYTNVRGVFHGHDHDEDSIKMLGTIPHLYDSHIGGNWGTPYKGYRIVELLENNTIRTYLMNPTEKIKASTIN